MGTSTTFIEPPQPLENRSLFRRASLCELSRDVIMNDNSFQDDFTRVLAGSRPPEQASDIAMNTELYK